MDPKGLPIVSFLVPSFNRADLLEQAITSLLSQSYKNIEIIVIDDASTDGTEAMIKSKFNGAVKYLKNNVNRGGAYSRNMALGYAKGEYIGHLDSDDILLDRRCVEIAVEALESDPELSAFTCDAYCIDLRGNKIYQETFFQKAIDHRDIALSSGTKDFKYVFFHGIHSCGALYRKSTIDKIGFFDAGYKVSWDDEFFVRLSMHNPRAIYYHNKALAGYRIHGGGLSNNSAMYLERIKCRQDILNKHSFLRKKLGMAANKRLAELHIGLIDACLKEKKVPQAASAAFRSILLYPLILPELFMHSLRFLRKRIKFIR